MAVRKIIRIDEERCDGCGLCVTGCAEAALQVIDGKARLVSDVYCDGLGACLSECPNEALEIIEREAVEFDEAAVEERLGHLSAAEPAASAPQLPNLACGCPGSSVRELAPAREIDRSGPAPASALRNWPVQLHLVPPQAAYFAGADLLIAADCTGFALTNLHGSFLQGRALIIACPKLDDVSPYEEKLIEIFRMNNIKSLTLLYMTVPCCYGLVHLVRQALKKSGKSIPLKLAKVELTGEIIEETEVKAA